MGLVPIVKGVVMVGLLPPRGKVLPLLGMAEGEVVVVVVVEGVLLAVSLLKGFVSGKSCICFTCSIMSS